MKYYYIDKYLNYYNNEEFVKCERVERESVPDEEAAIKLLKNKNPNCIINKNYISVCEEYALIIKNGSNYNKYFKEQTLEGMFTNV